MRYQDTSVPTTTAGSAGGFKMKKRHFCQALRDGLMMGDKLSSEDLNSKEGFIHAKPWTAEEPLAKELDGSAKEPVIDVDIFFREFLDVYFEYERCLYDVLLVQNRWQDLRTAFRACNSVLAEDPEIEKIHKEISRVQRLEADKISGEERGKELAVLERQKVRLVEEDAKKEKDQRAAISKKDFGQALQKLVEKGKLTERERSVIIKVCERDCRFVQQGRYVGYIYFNRDFLQYYIEDEMDIHSRVFASWEILNEKFEQRGSALNYREFEQLLRDEFPASSSSAEEPGLKSEQIAFLIDVVDSNGDGTIGRSEFVERYAREDAAIQTGLRNNWHQLMQIMHGENKKGMKAIPPEYKLAPEAFTKCLTEGIKQNLFEGGKGLGEQLNDLVVNLEPELKEPKTGHIKYDEWLKKYVKDAYEIHQAFIGLDDDKKMPKW